MRSLRSIPLLLLLATGCGDEQKAQQPPRDTPAKEERADEPRARLPAKLRCPAGAANCESARGTILYVEAVDPDGDGDAHFVLSSDEGITGPGITVIDVAKDLRPDPLPGEGDAMSAAGPVYRGSYGQRQIEAKRLRVRRR